MLHTKRALLIGALVALAAALSAGAASAVTISAPGGLINTADLTLQTLRVQSLGYTYTCIWNIGGPLLVGSVSLAAIPSVIGGIDFAMVGCNEPGVTITPLLSKLGGIPGPWGIVLAMVLGLPTPTGVQFVITGVKFRVVDLVHRFSCLFTGTIVILFPTGRPNAQLLTGNFNATPSGTDNCPIGLALSKGPAPLSVTPITIGP